MTLLADWDTFAEDKAKCERLGMDLDDLPDHAVMVIIAFAKVLKLCRVGIVDHDDFSTLMERWQRDHYPDDVDSSLQMLERIETYIAGRVATATPEQIERAFS